MQNILLIQRHAPFNSSHGREALDLLLAMAAVEHQVSVLFSADAVYQLLPTQEQAAFRLKAYPRSFKLFALYDIDQVYVCQASLLQRNIQPSQLSINAQLVDAAQIQQLISQQHQVICS
ncbi:MAG: sulfurtransferase complex subunit TusC [Gammaproteobacteria bacterium]|nr:sulfurtransferase complex subunit TusC [Gammaproteobacteria bacterium]MBU1554020.1 sulfurtransferase complex subunit TusC [Gammaproteobacteria bacterium]MBU2069256.1 sulfurtransferase complex subunit TusC [Gammaproteobacteria bacterium]MBU2182153.1 sulfurtransferase complex subunit TusC [Gammaproteobacteria bacterium]MBU2206180.1 sulfurtransferase complex subunit TusC [Gammaproteobacteria bacterium]